MKLKKIFAIALLAGTLTLVACGGNNKDIGNTATETAKEDKKEYVPGKYTDTGYESEFLGIRFKTPEGFKLSTREELDGMMNVTPDDAGDEGDELQEKYAERAVIFELYVTNENATANMNISLEKASTSLEEYIENFKSQMVNVADMSVQLTGETEDVEVAGATYKKLAFTGSIEALGLEMKQECYLREVGNRIMVMTVSNTGDNAGVEALMEGIEAY